MLLQIRNEFDKLRIMQTHDQLIKKLMRHPGVKAEVERIEREEGARLDAPLEARQQAKPKKVCLKP
jgi:hypothetical protein